jgi:hypothetical protein
MGFAVQSQAHGPDDSAQHNHFHESEILASTMEEWELHSENGVTLLVMVRNLFSEPAGEPLRILVGYQVLGQDFKRLTAEDGDLSEKTFCEVQEPLTSDRDHFLGEMGWDPATWPTEGPLSRPGDYLIIPVHHFDETVGACEQQAGSVEALWLGSLN